MGLNDLVLPVLDRRVAWVVVEELGDWCVQRHRLTGHFRLVNTNTKLRYVSSFEPGVVTREFRARFSGKTGGATLPNVSSPTLGGGHFWLEIHADPGGWRIQRNTLTGHYRLLDPEKRRRAWGFDLGGLCDALAELSPREDPEQAEGFRLTGEGVDDPHVLKRLQEEMKRLGVGR